MDEIQLIYCEQDNTLLNKYKQLEMILSYFKKRFFDECILALRETSVQIKKTNNHQILKTNNVVSLKEDKPRIK